MIRFEYVAPPLPHIVFDHQATYDLGGVILGIYPFAGDLGTMVKATGEQLLSTDHQGVSVEQWLFSAYCDLSSVDRVLALARVPDQVPNPGRAPLASNAADLAVLDAMAIPISSAEAVTAACALFWHIRDRVAILLTAGPSLTISAGSELTQ